MELLGSPTPEESDERRLGPWQGLGLLGLGALTLLGCAAVPGPVGAVAAQDVAISKSVDGPEARKDISSSSVLEDVFSKPYPLPADWTKHELAFGSIGYKTVAPPGWSIQPAGRGFHVSKDADPSVFLEVRNVESASGLANLREVIATRKAELARQGLVLRETAYQQPSEDFHVSLNDVARPGGPWRAEIIVNADVGTGDQVQAATVTTVVYRAGEDGDVFPTILQNTVKSLEMNVPLPIGRPEAER